MEKKEREESRQILLPQNADEARTMALLGTNWLEQNAPEYLRSNPQAGAETRAAVDALAKALDDAVDSLKYVQTAHPEASGRGVRAERIVKAKAVLASAGAAGLV